MCPSYHETTNMQTVQHGGNRSSKLGDIGAGTLTNCVSAMRQAVGSTIIRIWLVKSWRRPSLIGE